MRDVLAGILTAHARGDSVALATVVRTWKSAPRPAGAALIVTSQGEVSGSVSGGCVEAALYELAAEVITTGIPRYESYGVSDDAALQVGLPCGGVIEVFVERLTPTSWAELPGVAQSIDSQFPVAVATVVRGSAHVGRHLLVGTEGVEGDLGNQRLTDTVAADVLGLLESATTTVLQYGSEGQRLETDLEVLVNVFAPAPRMIIFGAIDFAAALSGAGKLLGFHVTVVDARAVFATAKRFPQADAVVVDWPHRWLASQEVDARTVICVLTHDPKFDVPVLIAAISTPAAYIGAMGSRRTTADREERLREAGATDADLARIHAPIGLDLGARTPEETAISIAAEIIQVRWGTSGVPLTSGTDPIHRRRD
jgi:xanthine dehydrogenase accessory factor